MKKSDAFALPRLVRLAPRTILWLFLFSWYDWLARLSSGQPGFSQHSTVFCRVDLLGDMALQLPVLSRLVELARSQGNSVSIVCDSAFASVLSDWLPDDIETIGIDRTKFAKNPAYRFRRIRELSSKSHGAAVQLVWSRDLLVSDSVVRAINATSKLGLTTTYDNATRFQAAIARRFYTELFQPPADMKFHGSVNQWLARNLADRLVDGGCSHQISMKPAAERPARKRPIFYVFPGTSQRTAFKRWPEENFATIIDRVIEWTGWQCIIAGSADEGEVIRNTASHVASPDVGLADGTMSLTELYSELGSSALVISNDSGPAHVAASVGVDVLVVCGGGHPGAFFPYPQDYAPGGAVVHAVRTRLPCYGCGWHCTHEDRNRETAFPCITAVGVDQVTTALRDLLTRNGSLAQSFDVPAIDA